MNTFSRGVRNAFRNGLRTFALVIILAASLGLALSMLVAKAAVEARADALKHSVGNSLSIAPVGTRGGDGGGDPLTSDKLVGLDSLPHVTSAVTILADRMASDETSLTSPIQPGTTGRRNGGNNASAAPGQPNKAGQSGRGNNANGRPTTPPVRITGTTDARNAAAYGGQTLNFTGGNTVDAVLAENQAVVGTSLADKNALKVGSTFTAFGSTLTVVGIYDAGAQFANAGVVVGLPTLQKLTQQPNALSTMLLSVDSADHLASVTDAVKAKLGTSADVANSQDVANAIIAPLESVKTVANYSLLAAMAVGGLTIVLTMVMIVRERRREIGVMKAIGTPQRVIVSQFVVEAVTLTLLALVVGLGIATVAAGPLTETLVASNSSSANSGNPGQPAQRPGGGGLGRQMRSLGGTAQAGVATMKASLTPTTAAYGAGAALLLAILGSAVPALLASRIRPSESMRAE